MYIRKSLFLLFLVLLAACDREPDYHYNITQEEQTKFGTLFAGTYHGSYRVFWESMDGASGKELYPGGQLVVSDWTNHGMEFSGFPVEVLAKLVGMDTDLGKALKDCPPLTLNADYKFKKDNTNSEILYFLYTMKNTMLCSVPMKDSQELLQVTLVNTGFSPAFSILDLDRLAEGEKPFKDYLQFCISSITSGDGSRLYYQDGEWTKAKGLCIVYFHFE